MKKLVFYFLTLITCGQVHALPLGNPGQASLLCKGLFLEGSCDLDPYEWETWCDAVSARAGYYGDFVFNRHMEVTPSWSGKRIEHMKITTQAGYLAANIYDTLDIFSTFGSTRLTINTNASAFGIDDGSRLELVSNNHFSWSVGLRGTIFQRGNTYYGIEAQYLYARPDLRRATLADTVSDFPVHDAHLKYWEWQVGLGIAQKINNIVPYFGAKYSRAKLNVNDMHLLFDDGTTLILHNLDSKFNGGFVFGVSLVDCKNMSLSVEYRFPDERAFYVDGQIRF